MFWLAVRGGETTLKTAYSPIGLASTRSARQTLLHRPSLSLSLAALFLFLFLLVTGIALLVVTVDVALTNTLIIFVGVTVLGLWFCQRTCYDLADTKLKILSTLWLLKVLFVLFLLHVGWMPQLDPSSINWGYDPQRFYIDAKLLVENGWKPVVASVYQGVLFYYGLIFFSLATIQ